MAGHLESRGASSQQAEHPGVSLHMLDDAMSAIEPQMKLCINANIHDESKTTAEALAPCYQAALDAWDKRLNENYHYLMKGVDEGFKPAQAQEIKANIVESERHWIKARDEQFKALEGFDLIDSEVEHSIPEDRSIRGVREKVQVVENQAKTIFSLLDQLHADDDDVEHTWDKPL